VFRQIRAGPSTPTGAFSPVRVAFPIARGPHPHDLAHPHDLLGALVHPNDNRLAPWTGRATVRDPVATRGKSGRVRPKADVLPIMGMQGTHRTIRHSGDAQGGIVGSLEPS